MWVRKPQTTTRYFIIICGLAVGLAACGGGGSGGGPAGSSGTVFVRECLTPDSLSAAFHVSPTGNDSNPGTAATPWRTITKANNTLMAGETVLIHAGTYNDQIRPVNSGTSNTNRITYRAFGDGDVILTDFGGGSDAESGAIALGQRDYITVSGCTPGDTTAAPRIKLRSSGNISGYGNVTGSEGCIVENIEATHSGAGAPSRGFMFNVNFGADLESKWNILRNSRIVGVSRPSPPNTEDLVTLAYRAHNNLIENNDLELVFHSVLYADSPTSYGNVIRNNRISNPEHTALSIWSAGVNEPLGARFLVENNFLSASGQTTNPDGGEGNAFQWGSGELIIRHNVIQKGGATNNRFNSIGGLVGATSASFGANYEAIDGRVYNNTIVKNSGVAIGLFDFGVGGTDLGRNKYINNFLYDSNAPSAGATQLVMYQQGFDSGRDRYVNNVFGNPGALASELIIGIDNPPSVNSLSEAIANLANPTEPEFDADNVFDANLNSNTFSNYAGDDYRLKGTSPYIDTGSHLTNVAATDSGNGTSLIVEDSRWFYGEAGDFPAWMGVQWDWIAVGQTPTSAAKVQITGVNDANNTITLFSPIARNPGDSVWLWRDSDGTSVITGSTPDIGACEFGTTGNCE